MGMLGHAVIRRCAVAGLALFMAGAGLGLNGFGEVRAAGADDGHIGAHGIQFDLPKGVGDYDGYLRETWEPDGGSPLVVTLKIYRDDQGLGLSNADVSEAFANAVRSEMRFRTEWEDQRLLKSMVSYENDSLAFDVYYFYSAADDAMYAWTPILLTDGSRAELEVACPFDDFAAQYPAIDGFFGSLGLDGVAKGLELQGSAALGTGLSDETVWHGVGATVPDELSVGYSSDGVYIATGKGIGGDVPVEVTIKDGEISDVTVGDNSETQGIGSKAIEQLPEAIVAAGGTEGVDAVSGATITSKAIFSAVDECLAQASSGDAAADAATDEKAEKADESLKAGDETKAGAKTEGTLKDGEYTATGKGIGGDVPVTVTVKDGKISDVTVGDNSETQGIGSKAIEQLPALIVEANGVEGVDGVSGATITSKAIFSAVEDALAQATGW